MTDLADRAGRPPRNLPVDQQRLWDDLMALGEITDPARPYTRRSFTPLFLEGRRWLRQRFEAAGLACRIDAAGNLIGRLEGTAPEAGTIMIGSHSDTVPSGGRFDGAAGVLTGLEIVRSLADRKLRLRHTLEIVDFLAEEPSDFGVSCIGSRAMTGFLGDDALARLGPGTERLDEAIRRVGGDPAARDTARPTDLKAFFELHIEQGRVLEQSGIDIGIVTGIVGITRIEIVFQGEAAHAGTSAMDRRRDALQAGARMVTAVAEIASRHATRGQGYVVATTGVLTVEPNAANVVPARVSLTIDARAEQRGVMLRMLAELEAESAAIAATTGVERVRHAIVSDSTPAACDERLRRCLAEGASALGLTSRDLASGAGHDAAFISRVAPAAMVFVACRDGMSHCPEEWAEPEWVAVGAAAIAEAVLLVDRDWSIV